MKESRFHIRYVLLLLALFLLIVLVAAGRRGHHFEKPPFELFPDMDHQPKIKYQVESDFFADGMGSRRPVEGTLPMNAVEAESAAGESKSASTDSAESAGGDSYYNTGRYGDYWGDGMPAELTVDEAFLLRGKQRYGVYCAVCHGEAGNGVGITAKYGMSAVANYYMPEFYEKDNPAYRPDGSFYDTITNGKGTMGAYGGVIAVEDRWAIIAWIRTMQNTAIKKGIIKELASP